MDQFNQKLEKFGISKENIEYVRNLCFYPDTFYNFPFNEGDKEARKQYLLNEWQEEHVRLMLKHVKELEILRFKVCPSKMMDQEFWYVYFQLMKNKLRGDDFKKLIVEGGISPFQGKLVLSSVTSKGSETEQYFERLLKDSILQVILTTSNRFDGNDLSDSNSPEFGVSLENMDTYFYDDSTNYFQLKPTTAKNMSLKEDTNEN